MKSRGDLFNMNSEQCMKASLIILHVMLVIFGAAVLMGRAGTIIADMYSTTCWAIILNLGAIGGNKALQKAVDKMPGRITKTDE